MNYQQQLDAAIERLIEQAEILEFKLALESDGEDVVNNREEDTRELKKELTTGTIKERASKLKTAYIKFKKQLTSKDRYTRTMAKIKLGIITGLILALIALAYKKARTEILKAKLRKLDKKFREAMAADMEEFESTLEDFSYFFNSMRDD